MTTMTTMPVAVHLHMATRMVQRHTWGAPPTLYLVGLDSSTRSPFIGKLPFSDDPDAAQEGTDTIDVDEGVTVFGRIGLACLTLARNALDQGGPYPAHVLALLAVQEAKTITDPDPELLARISRSDRAIPAEDIDHPRAVRTVMALSQCPSGQTHLARLAQDEDEPYTEANTTGLSDSIASTLTWAMHTLQDLHNRDRYALRAASILYGLEHPPALHARSHSITLIHDQ